MSKIDEYLKKEISLQFSQEKMDEIYANKVGSSHMSEGLAYEFEKARELAKSKGWSIRTCSWCKGPAVLKDVRSKTAPLCVRCTAAGPSINRRLQITKGAKLDPGDQVKVANDRTTRTGPFWPSPLANKKAPRPIDKSL